MKKFLLVLVLASCSKKDSAPASAKVGETITLDDSAWTIVEAKDLGKTIHANNPYAEPKETPGRFVMVRFKIKNTHKNPESVLEPPKIIDDKAREIDRMPMEAMYLPNATSALGIEQLAPNVEKEFASLFELPPEATHLKFQVRGLGLASPKRTIDLGM